MLDFEGDLQPSVHLKVQSCCEWFPILLGSLLYIFEREENVSDPRLINKYMCLQICTPSFTYMKSFYIVQGSYFLKISNFSGNYFLFHLLSFQTFRISISYFSTLQGHHFLSRKYRELSVRKSRFVSGLHICIYKLRRYISAQITSERLMFAITLPVPPISAGLT